MEKVFFEKYGLHDNLMENILNVICSELNKDFKDEYIQYHKNILSIKEDIIIIINQFNKYSQLKKDLDIKKFSDIKIQIKYYIILINTFLILYALIVKNEYSYEIGFIPNHIFKKNFNKDNCKKCSRVKKNFFSRRQSQLEDTSMNFSMDSENNPKENISTSTTSLNTQTKILKTTSQPNIYLIKSSESEELDEINSSKSEFLPLQHIESNDNVSNDNVSNDKSPNDTFSSSQYDYFNESDSDCDPLSWKNIEIDNFKKLYEKKNYFNKDKLFNKKIDIDNFFWDKETENILELSDEKRIYLSECYTDIMSQKTYIWQLMDIDNDPIFKEFQIITKKNEIDNKFKMNEIKLGRKIKLADKKYKSFKKKYDILSISIIVLSTSLTILESIKLEFDEHFPSNGPMDIILRSTPISIGGLITFIGAFIKFSKYQEQMEEINIVSQKSITAISKLKTLREKLYFAEEKDIEEIIKEYQTNIYDEYNLCNQEIKKYVKSSDYDRYLRDIYITDYKIYCLEHDKQSLFETYRPNVVQSLNNPVYTNWWSNIKDFFH